MQTLYTVTKYAGQEVLDRRPGLAWDAAASAAVELGAMPGTGYPDGRPFKTTRDGVTVAIDTERPATDAQP